MIANPARHALAILKSHPFGVTLFALAASLLVVAGAYAATTKSSNFTQTIGAGTLSVDIVNGSYATVGSPSVSMGAYTFSFNCGTSTGTFGSASEQIYVQNPDAADDGWTLSVAASAATSTWSSAGTDMDFNDPSACTDGGDADSLAGRLTLDPSGGTMATGTCGTCGSGGVSVGSIAAFNQGVVDAITLLTSDGTVDIGDWTLQGISVAQVIPGQQPAASDYNIDMIVTVTAT